MKIGTGDGSRRGFLTSAGQLASAVALAGCAPAAMAASPTTALRETSPMGNGDWDLRWIDALRPATDRAVFDWPSLGDPADPTVLEIAGRYLDGCRSAYRAGTYDARVVLVIRSQAVGAAMTDRLWERYSFGTEFSVTDPATGKPAMRNPFWHGAPSPAPGPAIPSIADLAGRGAIILACDLAMTHLAQRLATKSGRKAEEVHADFRSGLIPGTYAVPSGIFGLARSQNAGCAYMRA